MTHASLVTLAGAFLLVFAAAAMMLDAEEPSAFRREMSALCATTPGGQTGRCECMAGELDARLAEDEKTEILAAFTKARSTRNRDEQTMAALSLFSAGGDPKGGRNVVVQAALACA